MTEEEDTMTRTHLAGMLIFALVLGSCAARSSSTTSATNQQSQRLTTATVSFRTLEDGKDAKSAVSVQLVRNGNELGGEAMSSGTEFDDNSTAAPLVMTIRGPFNKQDTGSGQLRLRLSPDGNDTWTFNVALSLRFEDETQRNYVWQAVRLDEKAPERTLVLTGAEGQ
jgi:hypothetical protein